MNSAIGRKIKNIRLSLGLTMEEFGKNFHTSKGTVNNWEKGRNLPNKENLKAISDLGNITVESLLGQNCEVCAGNNFQASWYPESNFELSAEYAVTEDSKLIIPLNNSHAEYLGFIDIDISFCPECGRKLEVKE